MAYQKLKTFFGLSWQLAKADFKLRNEGSYLGILWYLLNPLLMFGLLFLIFSTRVGQNIPYYPLYLLLGIIIFNFFQKTTLDSTNAIIRNRSIIKSINFPRTSLVFSIVLKFLFSHVFEIFILFIFCILLKIPILGLGFYPLILIFFALFIYGACLFFSSLAVYFIDLENIWIFVSLLIWLGTPIFYAIENQSRLFTLNLFNPLYYFITISRDVVIYNKMPELWMVFGMLGYTLLALIIGFIVFGKLKNKFAELI